MMSNYTQENYFMFFVEHPILWFFTIRQDCMIEDLFYRGMSTITLLFMGFCLFMAAYSSVYGPHEEGISSI